MDVWSCSVLAQVSKAALGVFDLFFLIRFWIHFLIRFWINWEQAPNIDHLTEGLNRRRQDK